MQLTKNSSMMGETVSRALLAQKIEASAMKDELFSMIRQATIEKGVRPSEDSLVRHAATIIVQSMLKLARITVDPS